MSVLEQIRIDEGYVLSVAAPQPNKHSPRLYHVHNQNGGHQFYESYKGNNYVGSVVTKLPAKYPLCLDNGIVLECPHPVKIVGSVALQQYPSRRKIIYDRDGNQCLACGSTDDLTLDHIVPSSKGGKSDIDNLQTLCRSCNLQKANRIRDYRLHATNSQHLPHANKVSNPV